MKFESALPLLKDSESIVPFSSDITKSTSTTKAAPSKNPKIKPRVLSRLFKIGPEKISLTSI